jgi:hypothetical protein
MEKILALQELPTGKPENPSSISCTSVGTDDPLSSGCSINCK